MKNKENFKFWGEDKEEDELIIRKINEIILAKLWNNPRDDEAWKDL